MAGLQTGTNGAARLLKGAFDGDRLSDLPRELSPATERDAYAIQDHLLEGETVAAWKVAPSAPGAEPRCAPIPATRVLSNGSALPRGISDGEAEVEIAARFVHSLPPRDQAYSTADVIEAIGSVHASFEILSSRFIDRRAVSPLSTLADGQSNRAIFVGTGKERWRTLEFADLTLEILADDIPVARKTGGKSTVEVISALVWLANHAANRGHAIKAGDVVITGARLGPIPIPACERLSAKISDVGDVSFVRSSH